MGQVDGELTTFFGWSFAAMRRSAAVVFGSEMVDTLFASSCFKMGASGNDIVLLPFLRWWCRLRSKHAPNT